MRTFIAFLIGLASVLLSACDGGCAHTGCAIPGAVPAPAPAVFAIAVSPGSTTIDVATQVIFTATLQNAPADVTPADVQCALAGASCAGAHCGTLTPAAAGTIVYTAPTVPPAPDANVKIQANAGGQSASVTFAITNHPVNNAVLKGDYAFRFFGFDLPPQHYANHDTGGIGMAGHFHADGQGQLTNIEIDSDFSAAGIQHHAHQTGTYSVGADFRGTMQLNTGATSVVFHFVVVPSGANGRLIEFDSTLGAGRVGSGEFRKQDATAFALAKFNGDFAFGMVGEIPGEPPTSGRFAMIGRFTTDAAGKLTHGSEFPSVGLPSILDPTTLSAIDATTGRGTTHWTMPPFNATPGLDPAFAFYVVDAEHAFFITTDGRQPGAADFQGKAFLVGEARAQKLPAAGQQLAGAAIYYTSGTSFVQKPGSALFDYGAAPTAGRIVFTPGLGNGGSILEGQVEQVVNGTSGGYGITSGQYSATSGQNYAGLFTLSFPFNPVLRGATIYLTGANEGFVIGRSANLHEFGMLEPQADVASGVEGDFVGASMLPGLGDAPNVAFTLRMSNGGATGIADVSSIPGQAVDAGFDGGYSPGLNGIDGRYDIVLNPGAQGLHGDFKMWHVRSGKLLLLPVLNNGGAMPVLYMAER